MSTCQVTRDLDTFKKGLGLHGAKARRCLLTTGHLLEVLQEVKASETRIQECCQQQRIFPDQWRSIGICLAVAGA